MADKEYISGEGAIFNNDYKKTNGHPDNKGKILIPKDLFRLMAEQFKSGNTQLTQSGKEAIEMDMATWSRTAKNTSKPYQYVKLEMPYKKPEDVVAIVQEAVAPSTDEDIPF
jgi:hypothetical protein|tara:strand:- start:333 stop:668 length:336 start_codon:yes stop_codon:yes gene_type:complete